MNGRKVSVLVSWLFLAVPFLLVFFDWASTRERFYEKLTQTAEQNSLTMLQHLQVSGSAEYQVVQKLTDFHRLLRGRCATLGSAEVASEVAILYDRRLKAYLPAHHIVVAIQESAQNPLLTVLKKSTAPGKNDLHSLVALLGGNSADKPGTDLIAGHLREMTGFPVNVAQIPEIQDTIKSKDEGIMLPFTSDSRYSWLYWFYPQIEGRRIMLGAVFDAAAIPADYSCRMLAETVDSDARGIALLPLSAAGKTFWSGFFADKPALKKYLRSKFARIPMMSDVSTFDDCKIFSAPMLVGDEALVILVERRLKDAGLSGRESLLLAAFSLLFASLSFMLLQRRIFKRGWRMSIGLVLFTAIFSIFYLPAGIGRLMVQYSIDSHVAEMKQEAETSLERNMQTLEDRFHQSMVDFYHRLSQMDKLPEVCESLRRNDLGKVLEYAHTNISSRYPKHSSSSVIFSSIQTDAGENMIKIRRSEQPTSGEMFAPIFTAWMARMRPDKAIGRSSGSSDVSLDEVKKEMILDFLIKFFQGVIGRELFHNLMADPVNLVEARSTFVMAATTVVPIRIDGAVRAILLAIWSEFNEAECYLDFLLRNPGERAENFEFIALRKVAYQNFCRQTCEMMPAVWNLSDKTRRVEIQLTSRELMTTDDRILIKSRPGKSLGLYILTGYTSLKRIFERQIQLENGFNIIIVLSLVILLFLVVKLYRLFMQPLLELQGSLVSVRRGDFQKRLPVTGSNDEFDCIRGSFNKMARGLEEGSLLGRFVSSAVINVVRDKEAFKRALSGERRRMTILFASIKIAASESPDQIYSRLTFNLKTCQEALKNSSGVIDKVIEEKIMIFFDHEACGGEANAATACLEAVIHMKCSMEAQNYSGYFGMATGSVVAGVLGARNLRLDYTVIGDAVNLAARLNAMARVDDGSHVIADAATSGLIAGRSEVVDLGGINIKGKAEPVLVYRVNC